MKKILISLATIALVSAVAIGATRAYFSDTETSTGNTFTAGAIDMKIDFEGYYNKLADGQPNAGHWDEKDLVEGTDKFFDFEDIKPGDFGEGTISLHVYDNDAWGSIIIEDVEDLENSCTEPEKEAETGCENDNDGEIREALTYYMWLDHGVTPGFQGKDDLGEGDNIWAGDFLEPLIIPEKTIDPSGEVHNLVDILPFVTTFECLGLDGSGHYDYGHCHGLASDGRLVASTTYYFGIVWNLPAQTGNEAQTDSLGATIRFKAEQHRNNPQYPYGIPPIGDI